MFLRLLSLAVVALTSAAAMASSLDDTSKSITRTYEILDTAAIRRSINEMEALRAQRHDLYQKLIDATQPVAQLINGGKKPTNEIETAWLDSVVAFAPVKADPKYSKIMDAYQKGKFHKDLLAYIVLFRDHLLKQQKMYNCAFIDLNRLPVVKVDRSAPNHFYRPGAMKNPALLDTIDVSFHTLGWEWLDTDRFEQVDQQYPRNLSFRRYARKPELKVIGSYIFDADGHLLRVNSLRRGERDFTDHNGQLWTGIRKAVGRIAYEADRYGVKAEGDPVNPIIRARLGIDNDTTLAKESNMKVDAWFKQIGQDHQDDFKYVYRIDRRGDLAFDITFLNPKGDATWKATVSYSGDGFDVEPRVESISKVEGLKVNPKDVYRDDSDLLPHYMIPEVMAMYEGTPRDFEEQVVNYVPRPGSYKHFTEKVYAIAAVTVDAKGNPTNYEIIRSHGNVVDTEFMTALRRIKHFSPGRVGNRPVSSTLYIAVPLN